MKNILLRWTCMGAAFGLVTGFGSLLAIQAGRIHSGLGYFFVTAGWPSSMVALLIGSGEGGLPEWLAWGIGVFTLASLYASAGALIGILISLISRSAKAA